MQEDTELSRSPVLGYISGVTDARGLLDLSAHARDLDCIVADSKVRSAQLHVRQVLLLTLVNLEHQSCTHNCIQRALRNSVSRSPKPGYLRSNSLDDDKRSPVARVAGRGLANRKRNCIGDWTDLD